MRIYFVLVVLLAINCLPSGIIASFPGLSCFSCTKNVEGLVSFLTCVTSRVYRKVVERIFTSPIAGWRPENEATGVNGVRYSFIVSAPIGGEFHTFCMLVPIVSCFYT